MNQGLFKKYRIIKSDGSEADGDYFVLKFTDKNARLALAEYAKALIAEDFNSLLAKDILSKILSTITPKVTKMKKHYNLDRRENKVSQEPPQERNYTITRKEFICDILCPYCSASWDDKNLKLLDVSTCGGCDTCGHGASSTGTIDITCHNCKRLMYRKEFDTDDY